MAAIELVSPSNKDRPGNRLRFVHKCATLLRKGVSVSIIDLVTIRPGNMYVETLKHLGVADPSFEREPSLLYAIACRWLANYERSRLQAWSYPLALGQPVPSLPLWLSPDLHIMLDLEPSYEQACHDIWLT